MDLDSHAEPAIRLQIARRGQKGTKLAKLAKLGKTTHSTSIRIYFIG